MSQYDFAIMSLPRSGSHMLMSALHSHPDITMTGEIGMLEKFPLPASEGKLRGCIVASYNLPTPMGFVQKVPMIFLLRDLEEIDQSPYHQHTSPAEGLRTHPTKSRLSYLKRERAKLDTFIEDRESRYMILTYNELCWGMDVRELHQSVKICEFLGVSEQPLRPLTYKPT